MVVSGIFATSNLSQGSLAAKERKGRKERALYFYAFSAFFAARRIEYNVGFWF
jgi:hypothetical protein